MEKLVLDNVKYTYRSEYQEVNALKGISFEFVPGKIYSIMGTSGSGKTTLLSLMAGLDTPTEGSIILDDVKTEDMDLEEYRREKVSVIYQDFRLFPLLTVAENIMYPMELKGMKSKDALLKAKELITKVGLKEEYLNRFPSMLSGGEQQRVSIARALGMNTKLLLADEPTGNLDTKNTDNIIDILLSLAHNDSYCVIVVTHDEDLAEKTDEVLHIIDGLRVEK
ncbi:MAG: ABC transporter ATP-binding protein [Clostridia bacterium]|nr:ABC transporter ATP-binding protein [Clostridia bacterium]